MRLFHFSEDPTITMFEPHVPATNPSQDSAVWAIDEAHQAAYWFPRDCARVTVWCDEPTRQAAFEHQFRAVASRLHAIEASHLAVMTATVLYRYELPSDRFEPWAEADGQWVAHEPMAPVGIEQMGDLVAAHQTAGIELRILDSLWSLRDEVAACAWPFSIIRMTHATPR